MTCAEYTPHRVNVPLARHTIGVYDGDMKPRTETKARATLIRDVCAEHRLSIGAAGRLWGISPNTLYQATAGNRITDDLLLRVAAKAHGQGAATARLSSWATAYRAWSAQSVELEASRPWVSV